MATTQGRTIARPIKKVLRLRALATMASTQTGAGPGVNAHWRATASAKMKNATSQTTR
jgi:hypothetical protein